jgi:hypothetical protein
MHQHHLGYRMQRDHLQTEEEVDRQVGKILAAGILTYLRRLTTSTHPVPTFYGKRRFIIEFRNFDDGNRVAFANSRSYDAWELIHLDCLKNSTFSMVCSQWCFALRLTRSNNVPHGGTLKPNIMRREGVQRLRIQLSSSHEYGSAFWNVIHKMSQ